MENYSFLDHVNTWLGSFIDDHNFSLNKLTSRISSGFQDNLLRFESERCQIQIYLEHYRVYVEISALGIQDPNLWYRIDTMACFVSKTSPRLWIYNLPRGIPLSQVIEQQLMRWQTILADYFDKITPLFDSNAKLSDMQETLNQFVKNFYSEQKNYS